MDSKEYKITLDEIMDLIAVERFQEAAELADRINWTKSVKEVPLLVRISRLYQSVGRFEDALEILLWAYRLNSRSRKIVYGICELYIEIGDLISALDFLGIYRDMAPHAVEVYILRYKILEKEGADPETRIDLLKQLCKHDYSRPEWRYQLAYMYHRGGFSQECVEECDKLITWFGSGPFVIKAMELKMLHAKLTPAQQKIYDAREKISDEIEAYESDDYTVEHSDSSVGEEDFRVKTIDMSKFNTINLQKALAESMRELMEDGNKAESSKERITGEIVRPVEGEEFVSTRELSEQGEEAEEGAEPMEEIPETEAYAEDDDIPEEEAYAEEEEIPEEEYIEEADAEELSDEAPEEEDVYPTMRQDYVPSVEEELEDSTMYLDRDQIKAELRTSRLKAMRNTGEILAGDAAGEKVTKGEAPKGEVFFEDHTSDIVVDTPPAGTNPAYESVPDIAEEMRREPAYRSEAANKAVVAETPSPEETKMEAKTSQEPAVKEPGHSVMDSMLSQGADGQISLAVPEDGQTVERQITGQMNLDDVMGNWEEIKKRKAQERQEKTAQQLRDNTGPIFKRFEQSVQDSTVIDHIDERRRVFTEMYRADDIELRSVEDVDRAEGDRSDKEGLPSSSGTVGSIWDEVDRELEKDRQQEKERQPKVVSVSTGSIPLVDTAATAAESLVLVNPEEEAVVDAGEQEENLEDMKLFADENADSDEEYAHSDTSYIENLLEGDDTGSMTDTGNMSTGEIEAVSRALEGDTGSLAGDTGSLSEDTGSLSGDTGALNGDTAALNDGEYANYDDRDFSVDERALFEDFLYSDKMHIQILDSIDQISLAPYMGNVIVTGDSDTGVLELSMALVKEMQMIDGNFISSRVAKISGKKMNKKRHDLSSIFQQLANGALLVERAADMKPETCELLMQTLESTQDGILVVLMDEKKAIDPILEMYPEMDDYFGARIDITPMNDNVLVELAKDYAYSREYKIDEERGVLALHQRISELQIGEHHVTRKEVCRIVDDAIAHSGKMSVSTYLAILSGKRYDYEDMIILREKDFVRTLR